MQIHNRKNLKKRRKTLRNSSTPAESFLWKYLQNCKLGRKFRRQHSIGPYIIDFYCPAEKLAVELDGSPHFFKRSSKHDDQRTGYLNLLGIKVIRFENSYVFEYTDDVLKTIKNNFTTP